MPMRNSRRPLTRREQGLLYSLLCELPYLRASVGLAKTIAETPWRQGSHNPVLNFALQRAQEHVEESMLLRSYEAMGLLDRALHVHLGETLCVRQGRDRVPADPILALVHQLRHERVAHRVVIGGRSTTAWYQMQAMFGSVWAFIDVVFAMFEAHLNRLHNAGVFEPLKGAAVSVRLEESFTSDDLTALVEAGNALE